MNILFINKSDSKGGAARFTRGLMAELEKRGHTVSLFTGIKRTDDQNVHLIRTENKYVQKLSAFFNKDLFSIFHNFYHRLLANDLAHFNNKALLESNELKEADIIHCNVLHGNFFNLKSLEKLSKEKPVIWSVHDMWPFTPHHAWMVYDEDDRLLFAMESKPAVRMNHHHKLLTAKKNLYEKTKINIVNTSLWMDDYAKHSIIKKQNLHYIPNGINTEVFKPRDKYEARQKLGLPQDKKIICIMAAGGKHNPQKGWKYAAEVITHFKNHDDVFFLCVGGSKEDSQLSNENIRYVEYISHEDLYALHYNASDIFLHTSMGEAFCLVAVEALASGIPVVAFPVGIIPEAVQHRETGYLATYQDAHDAIGGVIWALELSNEQRRTVAEKARSMAVEKYSLEKMVNAYEALYTSLINR